MAGDTRIELVLRDSKSPVLPLHQSPTKMVPPERFELPTPGFVIQCSIQLSQGGEKTSPESLHITEQTLSQSE